MTFWDEYTCNLDISVILKKNIYTKEDLLFQIIMCEVSLYSVILCKKKYDDA